MLALTRKIGERIIINGNVEVILLSTRRGSARIGILAPREVPILREDAKKDTPNNDT